MKCGFCGKSKIIEADHEIICKNCGVVLQTIESDLGRSEFTSDMNSKRTGAPSSLTMHDRGLSTIIDSSNKDSSGKPLNTNNRAAMKRLRTWDSRSQVHESIARTMREAMGSLNNMVHKL